jgi:opacity protein-like surface antigen
MQRFFGLLLVSFFFVTSQARAELLIEPVIGYNLGAKADFKENAPLFAGKEYSGGRGPSFGGRLGYQKLGFQVGLDYLHSTLDMDHKDLKEDVSMDEWAAFVGFEFPILFRVYAGYIFSAEGETEFANNTQVDLKSGSGLKAGLGFTILPFLDINFEYRRGTFDEWKAGNTKFDSEVDYNSFMIGLSLPFTI